MSGVSDLDVLDPPATAVEFRGELLQVRPLTIGAVPALVRACRPIVHALVDLQDAPDENAGVLGIVDLIGEHGEAAVVAVAVCIGKPPEWVAGGGADEFIALATKCWEVNRDFFVRKLAPLLAGRAAAVIGAGRTPSSS